ncbi:MAG: glucosaminidase domain-containing protein [Campylobacterota bacterium]|nr:glucosaminidase domain-containing protein [Campylobacterota bacterium]
MNSFFKIVATSILVTTTIFAQDVSKTVDSMRLDASQKKFIEKILPAVDDIHKKYQAMYEKAQKIVNSKHKSVDDEQWLEYKMKQYDVSNNKDLLEALKPFPQSITLAQASIESGWGSSRFFKVANNIFGVHAFSKDVPHVMASGADVMVRKYASLDDAIDGYYYFLATKRAFKNFRELKMKSTNPYEVSKGLYYYSALGSKYSQMINNAIKYHHFNLADSK